RRRSPRWSVARTPRLYRGPAPESTGRSAGFGVPEPTEDVPHEPLDPGADPGSDRFTVSGDVQHPGPLGQDELDGLRRPADPPEDDQERLAVVTAGVEGGRATRGLVPPKPNRRVRGPHVDNGPGLETGLAALDQAEALEQLAGADLARERLPRLGVDR